MRGSIQLTTPGGMWLVVVVVVVCSRYFLSYCVQSEVAAIRIVYFYLLPDYSQV